MLRKHRGHRQLRNPSTEDVSKPRDPGPESRSCCFGSSLVATKRKGQTLRNSSRKKKLMYLQKPLASEHLRHPHVDQQQELQHPLENLHLLSALVEVAEGLRPCLGHLGLVEVFYPCDFFPKPTGDDWGFWSPIGNIWIVLELLGALCGGKKRMRIRWEIKCHYILCSVAAPYLQPELFWGRYSLKLILCIILIWPSWQILTIRPFLKS